MPLCHIRTAAGLASVALVAAASIGTDGYAALRPDALRRSRPLFPSPTAGYAAFA